MSICSSAPSLSETQTRGHIADAPYERNNPSGSLERANPAHSSLYLTRLRRALKLGYYLLPCFVVIRLLIVNLLPCYRAYKVPLLFTSLLVLNLTMLPYVQGSTLLHFSVDLKPLAGLPYVQGSTSSLIIKYVSRVQRGRSTQSLYHLFRRQARRRANRSAQDAVTEPTNEPSRTSLAEWMPSPRRHHQQSPTSRKYDNTLLASRTRREHNKLWMRLLEPL